MPPAVSTRRVRCGWQQLATRSCPEAAEDPLVEAGRPLPLLALEGPATLGDVGGELVQIEAAERAAVARVAREEGPLDRLGQVGEGEDGTVEVGEVGREEPAFLLPEFLDRVAHGRAIVEGGADAPEPGFARSIPRSPARSGRPRRRSPWSRPPPARQASSRAHRRG